MIVEENQESVKTFMLKTWLFAKSANLFILIHKVEQWFYVNFVEDCCIVKTKFAKSQVPLHLSVIFGKSRVFIQVF